MEHLIGKYVIVRTREQGVVCGVLRALLPQPTLAAAVLDEASQLHRWSQANQLHTLFEVARHGAGEARISEPHDGVLVFGVCGVLPCTAKAEADLRQPRWNAKAPVAAGKAVRRG